MSQHPGLPRVWPTGQEAWLASGGGTPALSRAVSDYHWRGERSERLRTHQLCFSLVVLCVWWWCSIQEEGRVHDLPQARGGQLGVNTAVVCSRLLGGGDCLVNAPDPAAQQDGTAADSPRLCRCMTGCQPCCGLAVTSLPASAVHLQGAGGRQGGRDGVGAGRDRVCQAEAPRV